MNKSLSTALIICLLLVLGACESRTDKTDGGGVLLSISDFDGVPLSVGVNATVAAGGFVQVGQIDVQNIIKDPNGVGSDLMNVELKSYEVVYSRADRGSRVPTPLVGGLFGVAPAGGTFTVLDLPVLGPDQLDNTPLSDLLFTNGGFDKETGEQRIILNLRLRFFGRTLSGDAVETAPADFPQMVFTP